MTAERTEDRIRYDVAGGIASIRLSRPPVNALDLAMVRGLIAALNRAGADGAVRAVVIASAVARRFCAGLDIVDLVGRTPNEIRTLVHALYVGLFDAQQRLGKPSIAAVNGAARGGGVTLAVSCDIILAAASASFGYPEIDLGVLPAIHFVHLPRIVGRHRAFELLFTGRAFGAEQAAALGLVNRVVADAELENEALKLADALAAKPEAAMRAGRAAFMRQTDGNYRRSITDAVEDFCAIIATEAAQSKLRAFAEKGRAKQCPSAFGMAKPSSQIAIKSEGFLELFRLVFRRRFEQGAGRVIAPHHSILDIKPVYDVRLRERDGLTKLHRVNHTRRIIDLAGKLTAVIGKRRNPKIFDVLAFANGNLERKALRARL
jgi:enoyl-CoA hydratase/carnithine racemase